MIFFLFPRKLNWKVPITPMCHKKQLLLIFFLVFNSTKNATNQSMTKLTRKTSRLLKSSTVANDFLFIKSEVTDKLSQSTTTVTTFVCSLRSHSKSSCLLPNEYSCHTTDYLLNSSRRIGIKCSTTYRRWFTVIPQWQSGLRSIINFSLSSVFCFSMLMR